MSFEELIENKLKNMDQEELMMFMSNLNRRRLEKLPHIKKYNKLRKLHGDVIDSMLDYVMKGHYDIKKELEKITTNFNKYKIKKFQFLNLDLNDADDVTIFTELFIYPNDEQLKSITDIYLEKNRYKNQEKKDMLKAIKNSYVSLFKVVEVDKENGYVYYEDVFTKKKYRIIDVAMSSTVVVSKKREIYLYNRIITIDDEIAFASGIHCIMTSKNQKLKKYIKRNPKKGNTLTMCMELYKICRNSDDLSITYRNQY